MPYNCIPDNCIPAVTAISQKFHFMHDNCEIFCTVLSNLVCKYIWVTIWSLLFVASVFQ